MPEEFRGLMGIHANMIRISVGIEHIDDQILDLERAFERFEHCVQEAVLIPRRNPR
jgi:O-acetylhomoserine/O-acetylserine sulfhydrylase-like pyridoxal-dependent enzyme